MPTQNVPATVKKELKITFADLALNPDEAFKNDQFKLLLNQNPKEEWLKNHPLATKKVKDKNGTVRQVPAQYLPIDKVEFMLDYIFQEWKQEIIAAIPAFNSIMVTVRLHYKNPVTGEWSFHDGIGASPMQADKGSDGLQVDTIKAVAVQIGAPAAASFALKDAAEHLGKLFGRDVNRADTIEFVGAYSGNRPQQPESSVKEEERMNLLIDNAKSRADLEKLKDHLTNAALRNKYDERYKNLK